MALSASIALSLHDLLWMRGSRVGINSAKAFSSPGAIVRAKESRALRPDCMFSSSFPVRDNSTVSRISKTDEDDEVRTSSESLSTRAASKSSVPDLSWNNFQRVFRAESFVQHSPSYLRPPSTGLSHTTQTQPRI